MPLPLVLAFKLAKMTCSIFALEINSSCLVQDLTPAMIFLSYSTIFLHSYGIISNSIHTIMLWSFPSLNKTLSHLQISLQLLLNFSLWENISKGLPCFSVSAPSYSIFSLIDSSQALLHSFPQTTLIRSRLAVNCLPKPMVSSPFILFNFIAASDTSDHYTFPDTFLLDFHDIHSTVK